MKKVVLALGLPLVLAACGTGGSSGAAPSSSGSWPKTAGDTTCAEWLNQMTSEQQSGLAMGVFGAAVKRDVENAVQASGNPDSADFAKKISGSCEALGGDRRVSDIAAMNMQVPMGNPNPANPPSPVEESPASS